MLRHGEPVAEENPAASSQHPHHIPTIPNWLTVGDETHSRHCRQQQIAHAHTLSGQRTGPGLTQFDSKQPSICWGQNAWTSRSTTMEVISALQREGPLFIHPNEDPLLRQQYSMYTSSWPVTSVPYVPLLYRAKYDP